MIPTEWLKTKFRSVQEMERHLVTTLDVPPEEQNHVKRHSYFDEEPQIGDELWYFNNGKFAMLGGRDGYALVRNGKPISTFLTKMG